MSDIYCPTCGKKGEDVIKRMAAPEEELAIDGVIEINVHHYRCGECHVDFWIAYGR